MSVAPGAIAGRAAELRRAFDGSFAEPHRPAAAATDDLLACRLGADPYALRLAQVAGLFVDRQVTPLPGSAPAFLGLAAVGGELLPVYHLGALLGASAGAGRWLVVAAARPMALAFDTFEGHLRVPRQVAAPAGDAATVPAVGEVVHAAGLAWPVVDLVSVIEAITARAGRTWPGLAEQEG